jgi:Tfp pilus assembly protein PilN
MARRINLVPRSERARTTTDVGPLVLFAIIVIAIFAMGFGYYLLHNTLADREQELASAQQATASLEAQVAALRQFERLQSQRVSAEKIVQGIYANRTLVSEVMDAVSLVVPDNAWFASLSLSTADPISAADAGSAKTGGGGAIGDNKVAIEGSTYSFEDIAQVLVRFQLVPAISGVTLRAVGAARGSTDPAIVVRGFSIDASVFNTQPSDTPLPMSQVEVEGP